MHQIWSYVFMKNSQSLMKITKPFVINVKRGGKTSKTSQNQEQHICSTMVLPSIPKEEIVDKVGIDVK